MDLTVYAQQLRAAANNYQTATLAPSDARILADQLDALARVAELEAEVEWLRAVAVAAREALDVDPTSRAGAEVHGRLEAALDAAPAGTTAEGESGAGDVSAETTDPGYLADDVQVGTRVQIVLPDGTTHDAVVLATYKSGAVNIDYVNDGALAHAEARLNRSAHR